jgi:hypothetical protein
MSVAKRKSIGVATEASIVGVGDDEAFRVGRRPAPLLFVHTLF